MVYHLINATFCVQLLEQQRRDRFGRVAALNHEDLQVTGQFVALPQVN